MITRLLKELHLEVSRFTGNFLNFRKGQKLDVEMPADLDQLGGDNSHRAVVGGEGLVELRHDPADRRLFFDQIDVIAGIGKIESRLHPGDTASDHHNGASHWLQSILLTHEHSLLSFSGTELTYA